MIIQEVGNTSRHICEDFGVGDELENIVGPLGRPSEMKKFGTVVCVGGGIGVAPVYPIARAYKELGNKVISIIGGRTKELVLWEDKMRAVSDELIVCTDDGSYGRKGFVTQPLLEMLEMGEQVDYVITIGPVVMMRNVARTTEPFHVYTAASLNTMAKILSKTQVSPAVYELVVEAPLIARKCHPGQFVIVLSDPES